MLEVRIFNMEVSKMLVITRGKDESIKIGNDIEVTVLRVGNQIRLGVRAPKEVKILRAELPELPEKPKTVDVYV